MQACTAQHSTGGKRDMLPLFPCNVACGLHMYNENNLVTYVGYVSRAPHRGFLIVYIYIFFSLSLALTHRLTGKHFKSSREISDHIYNDFGARLFIHINLFFVSSHGIYFSKLKCTTRKLSS